MNNNTTDGLISKDRLLVAQEGAFQIWMQKGVPQEIIDFLDSVRFGTEGAVYEHLYTEDRVASLFNPYLCYATEGDHLVACIVVESMETLQRGIPLASYYIRYFAANPVYKGRGITTKLAVLFIDNFVALFKDKTIFYGVLEDGNTRSSKIADRVGLDRLTNIRTIGFSRFFPKKDARIERLSDPSAQAKHLETLHTFYKDYILVHFNHIFLKDDYFVIRKEGEIVAGVQMHRAFWRITSMPGLAGKFLIRILPYLPLFKKMFNPKRFEFITFEGIYYQPGHEDTLISLLEGLLAQEKLKTAIFWLAEKSPIYKMIMERAQLGVIHQFVKNTNTFKAYNTKFLSPEEEKTLKDYPPFISTFDFI